MDSPDGATGGATSAAETGRNEEGRRFARDLVVGRFASRRREPPRRRLEAHNPSVPGSNPGGPIRCRKHNDVAAQEPFCVSGRMTMRARRMRSAGWVPGLTFTLRLERVG